MVSGGVCAESWWMEMGGRRSGWGVLETQGSPVQKFSSRPDAKSLFCTNPYRPVQPD